MLRNLPWGGMRAVVLAFAGCAAMAQEGKPARALPDFDIRGVTAQDAVRLRGAARAAGGDPALYLQSVLGQINPDSGMAGTFEHSASGGSALGFRQNIGGIPVYEGRVDLLLGADGAAAMAWVGGLVKPAAVEVRPRLTVDEATAAGLRALGIEGEGGNSVVANLTILPVSAEEARLAWRMVLEAGRWWYEVLIDADTGALLKRRSLLRHAGLARVWRKSPLDADRAVVPLPDAWLAVGSTQTTGNNADVYLDTDADNRPDPLSAGGVRDGRGYSATQEFDFPSPEGSRGGDPRLGRAAALANLFYLLNRAHDYFYALGFDEQSWNFQKDNLKPGGVGGDAVRAEAHDPAYLDNAAMLTLPDGLPPRLQTGIFTLGTSTRTDDRDSALDGDVITHEYAHGVTDRVIGRGSDITCMSGYQSSAMSEGWSDYFATSSYNSPVAGAYVGNRADRGLRRSSYANSTLLYSDLGNSPDGYEPHDDGELWAATLWDLRRALGAAVSDKLVFEALRITPCRPTMIEGRDAIVAADEAVNQGRNRRAIWTVFAKRGMGASACGLDGNQALPISGWAGTVHVSGFDLPKDLDGAARGVAGAMCGERGPRAAAMGRLYEFRIPVSGPGAFFGVKAGPPGMTVDPDGVVRFTPSLQPVRFQVEVVRDGSDPALFTAVAPVATPLTPEIPLTISGSEFALGWFYIEVPERTAVAQVKLRGGAGDADLILVDPSGRDFGQSLGLSNNETLGVSKPQAGVWTVIVAPYQAYKDARLSVRIAEPGYVAPGQSVANLGEATGGELYFRTVAPRGTQRLTVRTSLGSGDADVFLRRGQAMVCRPVTTLFLDPIYDCRPRDAAGTGAGNDHTASVENPFPGDWYIAVQGAGSFSGVRLDVEVTTATPVVIASHAAMSFAMREGGPAPAAQILTVSESGGKPFGWTASVQGTAWLSVTPLSGEATTGIRVAANGAGLSPGRYEAKVIVTAAGLGESPREIPVSLTVTAAPRITASVALLQFQSVIGRGNPETQTVAISTGDGAPLPWSARVFTNDGGRWLAVSPEASMGSGELRVGVNSANLAPGRYVGRISVTAAGALSPVEIAVALEHGQPAAILEMLDGARGTRLERLAPGMRVFLTGSGMADDERAVEGPPYPERVGDVEVLFNGMPGELIRVTPVLIEAAAPFDLTGTEVTIAVRRGVAESNRYRVPLVEQALGIFSIFGSGLAPGESPAGAGWILGEDEATIARERPVVAGETATVFATGVGRVSGDGTVPRPVRVQFDGVEAETVEQRYSGRYRGGVYEILARVPEGLGRKYPVVRLLVESGESNPVTAGGPAIARVSPARVRVGEDAVVTITGVNFGAVSAVRVGEMVIEASADEAGRTIVVTVPAAALPGEGILAVSVSDPAAAGEEGSNVVGLAVGP